MPGKELLWKTDLSFFFPLPSVSPHGQDLDFQHPLLGPRLSNTTEPRAGREHSSHFYLNCSNSLLFVLNCPDSVPWILFFLLLYPITITIQLVNALQRSFSSLPSGHQRNQKTSHQNPKKSHGFIFQRSRNCHWGGSGSTHYSMLANLVIDTP